MWHVCSKLWFFQHFIYKICQKNYAAINLTSEHSNFQANFQLSINFIFEILFFYGFALVYTISFFNY